MTQELKEYKNLQEKLTAHIKSNGPISIEKFMESCLSDPQFGYYKQNLPIGADGDFITAPETSQIFGEIIGLWTAEIWNLLGKPEKPLICEAGPGRGTLISDALRALQLVPDLFNQLAIHLIETSQTLRKQQQDNLNWAQQEKHWHENLDNIPDGPTIIIANEFLDALPIRQFEKTDKGWTERIVKLDDDPNTQNLIISNEPCAEETILQLFSGLNISQAGQEDILELRPAEDTIFETLSKREQKHPFILLVIDYGHEESGFGDTLQAVKDHKYSNPLEDLGHSDLTAHVDFARLKRLAKQYELSCYGPITQGEFLIRLGLGLRLESLLKNASEENAELLKTGATRLVDPNQMGVLFKVMVISNVNLPCLPPFNI